INGSGGTMTLAGATSVAGALSLAAGTLNLNTNTLSLGGNLTTTSGTFNTGTSGTLAFVNNTTPSTVSGNVTFPNLSIVTAGKTVNFGATTSTIASGGALTVTGTATQLVVLTGTGWTINWSGVATQNATVNYAAVDHSTSTNATTPTITANNSINNGSNINWSFTSYTWSASAASTAWSTGSNWLGGAAPTLSSQSVIIPSASSNWPDLSNGTVSPSITNLTIASGGRLTIANQTLTVSGTLTNAGTITIGTGSLTN